MAMTLLSAISLRAESGGSFRPGDTLVLKFSMQHDDPDGPYTVDRQGEIRLPFVGSIAVAGLDRERLARAIVAKYLEAKIYSRLEVAVTPSSDRFITIPNPDAPGTIRVPLSSPQDPAKPPGDFFIPREKQRSFGIDPQVKAGE